jgi:Fic family protein
MELNEITKKIDVLKLEINSLRPISPDIEKRIWQKYRLDWNFHSNNLEGNSLTFGETKSFLLHGITAEGKPLKDHLDIKGHNEAILLLDDILKLKRPLTETFIRELHEVILHEPYENPAITNDGKNTTKRIEIGKYKKMANHVKTATGEIFYFASPEETPAKMNDLMDWYGKTLQESTIHPLIIASDFHYQFVRIHPFDDGNGRMARILMNLILMQFNFPPVIIKTTDKINYFRNLQLADGGNMDAFYSYIGEQLILSEELFIKGAKGEDIQDVDDIDKEISLLKARLQQETHKIIFDISTVKEIVTNSVEPLFNSIFLKLNQFDELFNKKTLAISYDKSILKKSGAIGKVISRVGTYTNSEKFIIFTSSYIVANPGITEYYFIVEWKDFIKTEHKFFSALIKFQLIFNDFYFTFIIDEGKKEDNESFKIFYHKGKDEKKFQKIASALAKIALTEIEQNLDE